MDYTRSRVGIVPATVVVYYYTYLLILFYTVHVCKMYNKCL